MSKFLTSLFAAIFACLSLTSPVVATSPSTTFGVETAILNTCGESDDGVVCILNLVVDILSIGVGILGVLGITIVGIQYLTAGGDEGKTRKAKQRMFEIVIGLVAYVVLFAILKWILPGYTGV